VSKDSIEIGSSPSDEDCSQVGSEGYYERMKKETKAFINQIRRTLGNEPSGAQLKVKGFPHDFGTYHEVICVFDETDVEAEKYCIKVESDAPSRWDDIARRELGKL